MVTRLRSAVMAALWAAVLATGLLLPSSLMAQEFDQNQREELGGIIREYLLENPELLREVIEALEVKERQAEVAAAAAALKELGPELFRSEADFVAGNPDGSVTMVEFFDYNCGYCKRAMSDVLALIESDDDLRVVLKEWPILGEGSRFAARAALASHQQGKYWEFHQALMETRSLDESTTLQVAERIGLDVDQLKADMESPEVNAVIDANMRLASALGIQGTPAFVIDDQMIPGAVGHEALAQVIGEVRDSGGCTIC